MIRTTSDAKKARENAWMTMTVKVFLIHFQCYFRTNHVIHPITDDLVCRDCNPWDPGFVSGGNCCNRKLKCKGDVGCCKSSQGEQCQFGEGDCDYHDDCEGKYVKIPYRVLSI